MEQVHCGAGLLASALSYVCMYSYHFEAGCLLVTMTNRPVLCGWPQVAVCQILGYNSCISILKPNMHYRLRMWRNDELEVARILTKKMLESGLDLFSNLTIDGAPKPNVIQVCACVIIALLVMVR